MFAKTANTITKKLQKNNLISSDQYEICQFGFQQGLSILLNVVTVIVIGSVMRKLWQTILFMVLYVPLRSNAGGYHARTATRCYAYSTFLMIAVLLAMKYLAIPTFIYIIALAISCVIIFILAPVEDANKPLDDIERVIYKRRTYVIIALEVIIYIIALAFRIESVILCVYWVFVAMSIILVLGRSKNVHQNNSEMSTHKP